MRRPLEYLVLPWRYEALTEPPEAIWTDRGIATGYQKRCPRATTCWKYVTPFVSSLIFDQSSGKLPLLSSASGKVHDVDDISHLGPLRATEYDQRTVGIVLDDCQCWFHFSMVKLQPASQLSE